ncbi:Cytochrome [Abeliophyllum distichum]|uniref:Cytochrome n=1 Tax=Abeliophyllum distichum TaxID=126358 RepID=A0ABD1Q8H0_9LAMI
MLSNSNLEASYNLRKDKVQKAIRDVYTKIGTSIDIGELAFVTELNVVMNLLWGGTIDGDDKQDKIGAEFRKVASKFVDLMGKPNISDFFSNSCQETFRLHPRPPLLVPRISSQSCMLGGYTIPKGSRVFLNTWSVYMDPLVWENPSNFNPERFLNIDNDKLWDYLGNSFEYLPFGSGRRKCPGLHLAEKMVMYVLASLLHSFDRKLPEGENVDLSETFGIVIRKTKPLIAIPSPRLSSLSMYE